MSRGPDRALLAVLIGLLIVVVGCSTGQAPAQPTGTSGATDAPTGSPAVAGGLVINSCGGLYGESIETAFIAPFEEDTGIDVVYDPNCDDQTTKLAAHAEAGQVQWDVIGGFGGPLYKDLHDQGLLATIDHEALGSDVMGLAEGATQPFGLGFHHDGVVVGYHASQLPEGATPTVEDYFDLEAYPGARGMTGGGFEDWTRPALALVADGVEPADLIPLDWERAFAKLDTIKDEAVFWTGGTEMMTVMLEDRAVMCLCSDARMLQAQREDDDIKLSFDGALRSMIFWAIPEGAPHSDMALEFLASTLDPERQAHFTELIGYSGVNGASYDLLPAELQSQVLVNPENLSGTWAFTPEQDAWLAENASDASERYSTWVSE
ncbi:MAG TPA: extracellular solute-binding protein [Candidatus Limnocylindrales bacterium]|nr:extracellular solute-binding protein [Candidatus Limnocylindrales bacterium]